MAQRLVDTAARLLDSGHTDLARRVGGLTRVSVGGFWQVPDALLFTVLHLADRSGYDPDVVVSEQISVAAELAEQYWLRHAPAEQDSVLAVTDRAGIDSGSWRAIYIDPGTPDPHEPARELPAGWHILADRPELDGDSVPPVVLRVVTATDTDGIDVDTDLALALSAALRTSPIPAGPTRKEGRRGTWRRLRRQHRDR